MDTLYWIYFTLKGKILLDYTNLLSPNEYKKNDKIILKCKELNDKDKKIILCYLWQL